MPTIEVQATTTLGVEDEDNREEVLDEISKELNRTVWDFEVESHDISED